MLLEVDLGPFAPVVGYVGAILASVYGIWTLIWRKKVWETPQSIIPKEIRGLLGVILGVGMVYIWLSVDPQNLFSKINSAIILVLIAIISFVIYFALLGGLTYERVVAVSAKKTKSEKIVGGLWLRKEAKQVMKGNGVRTIQELFKGAAYNPDELWTRASQWTGKSLIIILYLAIVTCGTLGLTTSGFVVQVKLTNKPASQVIDKSDSPGLIDTRKNR